MGSFLQLQVQGQPRLESLIQQITKGIDTKAILDEGAAVLFNRMRTRFLQETDPMGVRWPVSKAALYRQKIGRGGGTLFDKGQMFRSFNLYAESENTRTIGVSATSKSGFPYPIVHQYGIGQVLRQFVGFGPDDLTVMSDVVMRILKKAFA